MRFILCLILLLANTGSAKISNDCGPFNGARCSGYSGRAEWTLGPDVWFYDADIGHIGIPLDDEPLGWQVPWSCPEPESLYVLSGPCIEIRNAKSLECSIEVAFDLSHPLDDEVRQIREFPAFALVFELHSETTGALATRRIDFSPAHAAGNPNLVVEDICDPSNPCVRHWHLKENFQKISLSVGSVPETIKCVDIRAFGASRLHGSGLVGKVIFRNGSVVAHLKAPLAQKLDDSAFKVKYENALAREVKKKDDLIKCEAVTSPSGIGGGYYTSCVIQNGVLKKQNSEPYPVDMEFTVEYVNTCTGTPISIGIMAGTAQRAEMLQGQISNTTLNGRGPLVFADFNECDYTRSAILDLGCSIKVNQHWVKLSEQTRSELENDAASVRISTAMLKLFRNAKREFAAIDDVDMETGDVSSYTAILKERITVLHKNDEHFLEAALKRLDRLGQAKGAQEFNSGLNSWSQEIVRRIEEIQANVDQVSKVLREFAADLLASLNSELTKYSAFSK